MKNLIWVAIFILVAVGVVGWGSHSWSPSPVAQIQIDPTADISQNPLPRVTPDQKKVELPQVDSERLWRHLEALAGERYEDGDRDRTRKYLFQQLQSMGFSPVLQPFERGVNVFAQRKGTDPASGAILVAAHYDSVPRSPGVDDNATGVATVLEVARLLGSRPTPRTLQVVLFDREELGLLGSLAFTGNESLLKDLQGVIVLDMVGYACHTVGCQKYPEGLASSQLLESAGVVSPDKGEFLAIVGDAEHLPLLSTFAESRKADLPAVVTIPVPLKGVLTPDVLRSDHAPFWYKGVGAVLVTDTANLRSPHYHQPTDTLATIDRPFFTGAAQVVVNATAKLLLGS